MCLLPNIAPYLVNKQKGSAGLESKVFFIWGTTCAMCFVFTFFCIPEVRNLISISLHGYQSMFVTDQRSFPRADRSHVQAHGSHEIIGVPQAVAGRRTENGEKRREGKCRWQGLSFPRSDSEAFEVSGMACFRSRLTVICIHRGHTFLPIYCFRVRVYENSALPHVYHHLSLCDVPPVAA